MTQGRTFFLNGQEYFCKRQLTLSDLLNYFNYKLSLLVVEYNNFICPKDKWGKIYIKNNDKIEIVTIVGGG
jgi:sulfur carrier protein